MKEIAAGGLATMRAWRCHRLTAWLWLIVLALVAMSLLLGPAGFGLPAEHAGAWLILAEIRLPRTVLAALIGGGLGIAGAALQGYLRNPLAEPGLIGITGGASLGAVIAIHTGASQAFALALPMGGLAGAALAMLAVIVIAGARSGPIGLILAGVAVSSIAGALTTLALNLAPNPFASIEIVFWMLGSLTDRSLVHVWLAAPMIVAGVALLWSTGGALDALSMGEDAARNLGVDVGSVRLAVIAGTALTVGAATAVAGGIGFIGLIVPHLIRPHVGHVPSRLLPASAAGGAALLLAADLAVRLLAPVAEIMLGVVTALIGAPFFLWLVLKIAREAER